MTAAELAKRINDALKIVEFGVIFNADETAWSVCRDDKNSEETRAILSSFLKNVETYEGRFSRYVYQWAREYDGITFDRETFEELHHVHPYILNGFLIAYINFISSSKQQA